MSRVDPRAGDTGFPVRSLCLVSPFPPPFGGMAVQADKLAHALEADGVAVERVRTNPLDAAPRGFIARVPYVRTLASLALFLRDLHRALGRTDAVYFLTSFVNFFFWVTLPAMILIRLHGKPLVLSARGGGARAFFNRHGPLVRLSMRLADRISTPSAFLRDVFRDTLGLEAVIVPNIADVEQFTYIERECFRPRFLVTRKLEPIYGVDCVIRAFAVIKARCPEAVLSVVGAGSQMEMLGQLARELGLADSIRFLGQVDHNGIQKVYARHDVLLNASSVDNLPGAILEAFASGVPVVSTAAGGIPYLVQDGQNGLLVPVGDWQGLAEAALRVIREPGLGARLARAGLMTTRQFAWAEIEPILKDMFSAMRREKACPA